MTAHILLAIYIRSDILDIKKYKTGISITKKKWELGKRALSIFNSIEQLTFDISVKSVS
jgi:hypothetical protein